jgi:hypothetical protein
MGVKLIVEVMQHAPETLSAKELYAATVLAENANDATRLIWSSIEDPEFQSRLRVKRARLYELVDALVLKGVLEQTSTGHKHGRARYRFAAFTRCPQAQRPAVTAAEAPERVREPQTLNHAQCPEDPDVSVRKTRTPTPLYPSTTTPPPSPSKAPETGTGLERGDGGTELDHHRAQTAGSLIAALPFDMRAVGPSRVRRLHAAIVHALAEGWTDADLKDELLRDPQGVRSAIGVWLDRLKPDNLGPPRPHLPVPPAAKAAQPRCATGGCRSCAHAACGPTGLITRDDDTVVRCPCWHEGRF